MIINISELNKHFFNISDIFAVEQTSDKKTIFITPKPRPTDAFLLLLTTSGICYQNGVPPLFISPGSLVYMPKNSHYTFENSPALNSATQKNLLFEFTLNLSDIMRSESPKHAISCKSQPKKSFSLSDKVMVVSTHNSEIYKRLFYSLIEALNSKDPSILNIYKTAYEIFDTITSNYYIEKTNYHDTSIIKNSLKYFENEIDFPKTIKEIAEICHVSISYYERMFRSCMGISPIEYRNIHRINQVKLLLQNKEISLNEIATQMGYCDSGYLCRFFKKKTGMTPAEYRYIYREQTRGLLPANN